METKVGFLIFKIASPLEMASETTKSIGEDCSVMKSTKYLFLVVLMLVAVTAGAGAQTETASTPVSDKKPASTAAATGQPAVTAADFQKLQEGLAAAQQQILALQEELRRRDEAVQHAQTTATAAAAKADAAQVQTTQQEQTVGELQSDIASLKSVSATSTDAAVLRNAVLNLQEPSPGHATPDGEQVFNKQMESAITIRFRGINITPGGYAAAEFVRRSRALSADLPTPFNSLTMPGASQSQLSEFFGSGRQSKTTVFV